MGSSQGQHHPPHTSQDTQLITQSVEPLQAITPTISIGSDNHTEEESPSQDKEKEKATKNKNNPDIEMKNVKIKKGASMQPVLTSMPLIPAPQEPIVEEFDKDIPLSGNLSESHIYSSLPDLLPEYPPLEPSGLPSWPHHLPFYWVTLFSGIWDLISTMDQQLALLGILIIARVYPPPICLQAIRVIAAEISQNGQQEMFDTYENVVPPELPENPSKFNIIDYIHSVSFTTENLWHIQT